MKAKTRREARRLQDIPNIGASITAVRFMQGAPPHPWWHYTAERKQRFAQAG